MILASHVTSKGQTTIPQPVRKALKLNKGDRVTYEIDGDRVVLAKVTASQMVEDPFKCFDEWAGEDDRQAYADF